MKHKLIGLFELITGIFGTIFVIIAGVKEVEAIEDVPQVVLGVLMFGAVAYAGNGLLNKKKKGVKHSILAQAFQIISFQVSGMYYKFIAASFFSVQYVNNKFDFPFTEKVIDFAVTRIGGNNFSITIYLIPLVLLLLLLKDRK